MPYFAASASRPGQEALGAMITASTFIPSASSGDPWSAAAGMEGSRCAP